MGYQAIHSRITSLLAKLKEMQVKLLPNSFVWRSTSGLEVHVSFYPDGQGGWPPYISLLLVGDDEWNPRNPKLCFFAQPFHGVSATFQTMFVDPDLLSKHFDEKRALSLVSECLDADWTSVLNPKARKSRYLAWFRSLSGEEYLPVLRAITHGSGDDADALWLELSRRVARETADQIPSRDTEFGLHLWLWAFPRLLEYHNYQVQIDFENKARTKRALQKLRTLPKETIDSLLDGFEGIMYKDFFERMDSVLQPFGLRYLAFHNGNSDDLPVAVAKASDVQLAVEHGERIGAAPIVRSAWADR